MSGVRAQCAVAVLCLGMSLASVASADEEGGDISVTLSLPGATETLAPEEMTFDYLVIRQDATDLFQVIARDLGMRLDLSDKVNVTLNNSRLTGTKAAIMDTATANLGLDWFAFNGVLYVSNRSEALTRIVRLGGLKPAKIMSVLAESGLPIDRLEIEPAANGVALALSGPPKLLALAEAMIEGIPPEPIERIAESEARIVTIRRGNEAEKVRLP